jgi:hypothetical protein
MNPLPRLVLTLHWSLPAHDAIVTVARLLYSRNSLVLVMLPTPILREIGFLDTRMLAGATQHKRAAV